MRAGSPRHPAKSPRRAQRCHQEQSQRQHLRSGYPFLADLIVAETIYALESFYKTPRDQIAPAMRSLVALRSVVTVDPALLLRALEVYEIDRIDFAEAYLVACAESSGVNRIASFDRSIDRVGTVERIEPPTT